MTNSKQNNKMDYTTLTKALSYIGFMATVEQAKMLHDLVQLVEVKGNAISFDDLDKLVDRHLSPKSDGTSDSPTTD